MSESERRPTRGRAPLPDVLALGALRRSQPELATAIDLHLELLEVQRRVLPRIPVTTLDVSPALLATHQATGSPILRYADIPIDITSLRLLVRQTAEVLQRFGMLDDEDAARAQTIGRDAGLEQAATEWFARSITRHRDGLRPPPDGGMPDDVMALALRPFLLRCAETLQPRAELAVWTHAHCPLCGGEPDLAVLDTTGARTLICGQCTLRWSWHDEGCPFCPEGASARVTSFATPDQRYRVYGCEHCRRYLKAYDVRRGDRPVMPVVDGVATLPLDAAAQQRGYTG